MLQVRLVGRTEALYSATRENRKEAARATRAEGKARAHVAGRAITTIGFDADDTLWHHETYYQSTQERFAGLLSDHADPATLHDRLLAAEQRNIGQYGFGVKGFTLSMIETAIDVTEGRVPASVIAQILAAGREMLAHPIELLPHARAAVEAAARTHRVILVTKGDLLDQERKLAQSGLGDLFEAVEIVSDKTPAVYARIFARHGQGAASGVMVETRSNLTCCR